MGYKEKVEQEWDTEKATDLSRSYHWSPQWEVRLKQSLDQVRMLSGLLGKDLGEDAIATVKICLSVLFEE